MDTGGSNQRGEPPRKHAWINRAGRRRQVAADPEVEFPGLPRRLMPTSAVQPHDVTVPWGVDGTQVDLIFRPHSKHVAFLTSAARNFWLRGDRGSAKSRHGIWWLHQLARRHPGFRYVVVRRQYAELEQSFLLEIPDDLERLGGERLGYRYNRTKHRVTYPNGSTGFFRVCDTERDLRKVLGLEFHAALIDESPELPWPWIVKIGTSLRAPTERGFTPLLRLLGNLKGESIDEHYFYFRVPDDDTGEVDGDVLAVPDYDPADWQTLFVALRDNPSLDEAEYRKRFVGLDAETRAAWLEGRRARGATLFALTAAHRVPPGAVELVPGAPVSRTLWTGLTETDPAVCLWVARVGRRTIVLCERVWVGQSVAQMAAAMRAVDTVCEARGWPVARVTYAPARVALPQADVFDVQAEFAREKIAVTLMPEALDTVDTVTRRIHQGLTTTLTSGPALQIVVGEKGSDVGCPTLWKSLLKQTADPQHPSRLGKRLDSGPARALGQYLLTEAAAATGGLVTPVEKPWWWTHRPKLARVQQ